MKDPGSHAPLRMDSRIHGTYIVQVTSGVQRSAGHAQSNVDSRCLRMGNICFTLDMLLIAH